MIAQELHRSGSFWSLLLSIDRDLAECARRQGCPCGGRLHCANYAVSVRDFQTSRGARRPRPIASRDAIYEASSPLGLLL